ncbi:MAG TPA: leucyl aminopeptidase [Ideonella sp.]|uniref:leucyl aminopeptidase n=1 Tax=Ideonella sp. TaxID=1929293 RepID=UPI002E33AE18|nr:leucyl aminopeptidase [Ideonella sp.]HEX5683396.1 leucyl aminopeptidase [Ideonella sp.]
MNFQALATPAGGASAVVADALIVVLAADGKAGTGDKALDGAVAAAVKAGDFERKAGRTLYLHNVDGVKSQRVVLSGARDASAKAFRAAVSAGMAALKNRAVKHLAVLAGEGAGAAHGEALAVAVEQAGYAYRHTKPSAEVVAMPTKVSLVADKEALTELKQGLAQGQAIGAGMNVAREAANRPANFCTPTWLGEEAKRLGKEFGFAVQVLDRKAVEKLGMGSFLSVARGSQEPLAFIVMQYNGGGKKDAPIVLVGKGITFDTGGISLKPGAEMDEMKFDMGGAASVLGTMRAVGQLKPKINVVGLIPACENMPSGIATKPGDVVTSMSGQTIEILNTDAEGRLILCDALTYAERFKPAAVIDIATLTGACVVALGNHHAGMFSPDDGLAEELTAASRRADDPCWRMPLDEEYDEGLKSNFADMANIGLRAGGAITAAKFLQRYTKAYPWAHLDIAGVAWKSGAAKGATGRPVGLLTHFVLARAGRKA